MSRRQLRAPFRRRVVRLRVLQPATKFPKGETFVARVFGGSPRIVQIETEPARTPEIAMARAEAACKAGREVTVRGQYTSDGTRWKDHGGRVVASCERKRWFREWSHR